MQCLGGPMDGAQVHDGYIDAGILRRGIYRRKVVDHDGFCLGYVWAWRDDATSHQALVFYRRNAAGRLVHYDTTIIRTI